MAQGFRKSKPQGGKKIIGCEGPKGRRGFNGMETAKHAEEQKLANYGQGAQSSPAHFL